MVAALARPAVDRARTALRTALRREALARDGAVAVDMALRRALARLARLAALARLAVARVGATALALTAARAGDVLALVALVGAGAGGNQVARRAVVVRRQRLA